jgi:hypothetical protein
MPGPEARYSRPWLCGLRFPLPPCGFHAAVLRPLLAALGFQTSRRALRCPVERRTVPLSPVASSSLLLARPRGRASAHLYSPRQSTFRPLIDQGPRSPFEAPRTFQGLCNRTGEIQPRARLRGRLRQAARARTGAISGVRQEEQETLARERVAAPPTLLKHSLSIVREFKQSRKISLHPRA